MTTSIVNGSRIKHPRPIETVTGDLVTIHTPGVHGLAATTLVQQRLQPIYRVHGLRAAVYCPDRLEARHGRNRTPWQPVIVPAPIDTHERVVEWLVAGIAADSEVGNAA